MLIKKVNGGEWGVMSDKGIEDQFISSINR